MIDDRDRENDVASDPPEHEGGGGEAVVMDEAEVDSDPPDHTGGGN